MKRSSRNIPILNETIFRPLSLMPHGDLRKLKYHSPMYEDTYRHEFATALGTSFLRITESTLPIGALKATRGLLIRRSGWARQRNRVVLTHDLDFGVLLSMAQEAGPSVIQVRTQDVTPEAIGSLVLTALKKHKEAIDRGALLSIQAAKFACTGLADKEDQPRGTAARNGRRGEHLARERPEGGRCIEQTGTPPRERVLEDRERQRDHRVSFSACE